MQCSCQVGGWGEGERRGVPLSACFLNDNNKTGSEATPVMGQPDCHWDTDLFQPNIPDPHGLKTINIIPTHRAIFIDWIHGYIPEACCNKRVKLRIKQPPTMGFRGQNQTRVGQVFKSSYSTLRALALWCSTFLSASSPSRLFFSTKWFFLKPGKLPQNPRSLLVAFCMNLSAL